MKCDNNDKSLTKKVDDVVQGNANKSVSDSVPRGAGYGGPGTSLKQLGGAFPPTSSDEDNLDRIVTRSQS